jgi:hypothetical protein
LERQRSVEIEKPTVIERQIIRSAEGETIDRGWRRAQRGPALGSLRLGCVVVLVVELVF